MAINVIAQSVLQGSTVISEPIKVLIEMHLLSGSTQAFSFERIGKLKYKTKVKGQAIVDKYVSVH